MPYKAKIVLDSICPTGSGIRLTTMEVTYPRFVHSEFMTHRMFSRNAASSRAIPVARMIKAVIDDPAMPVWWGKNEPGMQANEEIEQKELVQTGWLDQRNKTVETVKWMVEKCNLHKQTANRLLEPWAWITVIVTATEWENFFALRCHPDAQPELQKIAYMMQDLYRTNEPDELNIHDWHLPYVTGNDEKELRETDFTLTDLVRVSVGRCARVSYLTHDGIRDPQADIELCNRLAKSGHWSPFEHIAEANRFNEWLGNFRGWKQYRKRFENENKGLR